MEHLREEGLPATLGLGRDERPAGEPLAELVAATASAAGAEVIDFGVTSTPATKLAARRRGLGGAVMVTGSHLAADLNGLKLISAPVYGPFDVRRLVLPEEGDGLSERGGRVLRQDTAPAEHVAAILAALDADAIRAAGLRVRITGGAGRAAALLLEQLGGPAGGSTPDLALELDADADRVRLTDERGRALDEEVSLPLTALSLDARDVVKGADTSRMIDDLVAARGGSVRMVTPGELHLIEELTANGGDVAGEGNGGVVLPAVGAARDGLAAGTAIMQLIAKTGSSLSELAAGLPRYARRRSTFPCAGHDRACAAIEAVAARVGGGGGEPDAEEGLLVERDDAWALVRQSATEPVLRLTVEAPSQAAADDLHGELEEVLRGAAGT